MKALVVAVWFVVACSGKSAREKPVDRGPRLQITYEIDLDIAVDDRARELRRDLEAGLADAKIAASVRTPLEPVGGLTIIPADRTAQPAIEALVRSSYADTVEQRECDVADGPLAVCIKISSVHAVTVKRTALTAAVGTVRARLAALGVEHAAVFEKDGNLVIELPAKDPERMSGIRDVIARTGKLEFVVVDDGSAYMKQVYAHVGDDAGKAVDPRAQTDEIRAEADQWRAEDGSFHADYYLIAHDREAEVPVERARQLGCLRAGPERAGQVPCRLTGRAVIEKYLQDLSTTNPQFRIPDDRQIGYEYVEPDQHARDSRPYWRSYYLERDVRLTGKAIANAEGATEPNMGAPMVLLDFNREGSKVFGDLTASIVGKKLATILDGKIKSAPIINGAIRGGRASIWMGGSDPARQMRERDELVQVLKVGSLPAPLREASIHEIGPARD